MDSRNRRDGAAIEELGWYNPVDVDHSYNLKEDRIISWLREGAQPTDAAHKLLRRAGIAHHWHLIQQGLDETQIEKEMKKWELNREDVVKSREEKKAKRLEDKAASAKVEETVAEAVEETVAEAVEEPAVEALEEPVAEAVEEPAEKSAEGLSEEE
jgi:small subunit ribosomal protein S16